ncbi:hypothetical protein PIB30_063900 [Stylosanthes scabra]|uniref:Uncharacterized protein n=1 Tax=Stylosanthes scabra TaxID=79078 RepID=A0ABU6QLJ1_9FABA|nr:hypothetical protein [Stylosanthes scabra]
MSAHSVQTDQPLLSPPSRHSPPRRQQAQRRHSSLWRSSPLFPFAAVCGSFLCFADEDCAAIAIAARLSCPFSTIALSLSPAPALNYSHLHRQPSLPSPVKLHSAHTVDLVVRIGLALGLLRFWKTAAAESVLKYEPLD